MRNENQQLPRGVMSKAQLAMWYLPNAPKETAYRTLRRLIHDDPELLEALKATHYRKHGHLLTPLQVQIICSHFGNP